MANALIQNPVDRENHIVHGVKVLGFTSANGRIYDFAAVKEAIAKYEKAPVNKDHNMEEPSFSDRLGWLENVTLEKDGLYADFHYNPHAEGIESFLWFAEHNGLGDVGFSHLVSGKYSVDPDGTERITRIDKVKSVDLVANPATTKTIFESEVKPMDKKLKEGYKSIGSTWTPEEWKKQVEKNIADTKKTFPNVKFFTKDGHPDWHAHGINPKTMEYYSRESKDPDVKEADDDYHDLEHDVLIQKLIAKNKEKEKEKELNKKSSGIGKKITKEAGNAANKVKKNELDREKGAAALKDIRDKRPYADKVKYQPSADYQLSGKQKQDEINLGRGIRKFEQEDDDVEEARAEPKPTLTNQRYWNLSDYELKSLAKDAREASARVLKMGDMKNAMRYDEQNADAATVLGYRQRNPKDPVKPEQEGDDEMDKEKLMEEENPMQQEEAEQDPMMEEADDVYAKVKEVCEGEGSDEEKSKQVLEMLGLSGGMSEGEGEPMEEAEEDPEEKDGSKSDVLEVDDEEEEEPKKESKSELAYLRKWKSEKLKQEKIVNLIKESNLEPTKVFIKQLSAIDSKLWGEAIRDRRKVALTRSAVKPISSGSQSRSESSYKQFLESVLGK